MLDSWLLVLRAADRLLGLFRLFRLSASPLPPDYAADEILREAAEYATAIPVHLVDEILITRNLPNASSQVLAAVGQ